MITSKEYLTSVVTKVVEVERYHGICSRKMNGYILVNPMGNASYLSDDTRVYRACEDAVVGDNEYEVSAILEDETLYIELS